MPPATKFLPDNYVPAGSVTLNSKRDLNAMLLWSVLLLLLSGWGAVVVLNSVSTTINSFSFTFSAASWTNILLTLGGILMVTAVMVVIHEGLHGLVFWWITHEMPKFAFKGFYASASAPGWYIGKLPYLIAALLPLFAITSFGLLIIPLFTPAIQFLLALLVVFNASGCAGDVVVAIRLIKLAAETLVMDHGDRVLFFTPQA